MARPLKKHEASREFHSVPELKDYVSLLWLPKINLYIWVLTPYQQLGDCLGKGAFGSVFRALNMGTGETVAVKQIKLADLHKSELRVITVGFGDIFHKGYIANDVLLQLEIDLLKNLDV